MIRLLIDDAQSGARNMAIDECLLEQALHPGRSTVRIYAWHEPTVSLGYFQPAEDPDRERRFGDIATVRRLSGGGAILHDHEITYSFALPADHPLGTNPSELYERAHAGVLQVLHECGVHQAKRRGVDRKSAAEPFLCFSRGDKNDIVIGAIKIVGSAQRRRRGAVLQHGSLLLRRSHLAEELPGLEELVPEFQKPNDFETRLGVAIASRLDNEFQHGQLDVDEEQRVTELVNATYSRLDWGRG